MADIFVEMTILHYIPDTDHRQHSESRKTVTFAEVKSSASIDSLSSSITSVQTGPDILKLIPNHEASFPGI